MNEGRFPTEEELDALLEGIVPSFDPDAVKRRTMERIGGEAPQPRRRRLPIRSLFAAAVVCALSVSTLAASYASDGPLVRALGIRKPEAEPYSAEPAPEPEPTLIPAEEPPKAPDPAPAPVPEPEPEPEPPVLDAKLTEALHLTQQQAQALRPAVQNVDLTAQDKDVTMTVLQTLGDPSNLYLTVRFDFPETVPVEDGLVFREIDIDLDQAPPSGFSHTVVERTEQSVTYLFKLTGADAPLMGQTITLSFSDYGRENQLGQGHIQLPLSKARTVIIDSDGNINANATPEEAAALAAAAERTETTEDGFTVDYLTDGTKVVCYDGSHGLRYLTVFTDSGAVQVGDDPTYDLALQGSWSQSWVLDYQDLALHWTGEAQVFENVPPVQALYLSPLSWQMEIPWNEYLWVSMPEEWDAQLVHEDGTVTDFHMKRMSSQGAGDRSAFSQVFSQPMDLSGVTALIINGVEFPLC